MDPSVRWDDMVGSKNNRGAWIPASAGMTVEIWE